MVQEKEYLEQNINLKDWKIILMILSAIILTSCGMSKLENLPEIPHEIPTIENFPTEENHHIDSLDSRVIKNQAEFDVQLRDENGQIYHVSLDDLSE
tara:strand:+ start:297 stop:587 length:291 start_codon:yes stop_codon:yes gene_type:complete